MYYIAIIVLSVALFLFFRRKKKIDLSNEHCLVTGGSSGIGLALAIQAAQLGANVTIIARSQERLEAAKEAISSNRKSSNQVVLTFSEDLSTRDSKLENVVKEAESQAGPITLLVNCAGTSICYPFEDTSLEEYDRMLNINYFGSINMTRAVLPLMKKRKCGRIVFVSSISGVLGLYGYTAYSGSKFAVRGLAEALQMEVKPYNISITVSYPPDTDTPGFAEEIKTKPIETIKMSESGGLYSAEAVASKTLQDAMDKKFTSAVGFEGWMVTTAASGLVRRNSFLDLMLQVMTMGILRLGFLVYLKQCDQTVKHYMEEREKKKVAEKSE